MEQIKIIDGIPCIMLDDGIIWIEEDLKSKSNKVIMPEYFTKFLQSKEQSYYNKVLEELKKKFREK